MQSAPFFNIQIDPSRLFLLKQPPPPASQLVRLPVLQISPDPHRRLPPGKRSEKPKRAKRSTAKRCETGRGPAPGVRALERRRNKVQ